MKNRGMESVLQKKVYWIERAHQTEDDRLSALYRVKAGAEINGIINDFGKQQGVIDDL